MEQLKKHISWKERYFPISPIVVSLALFLLFGLFGLEGMQVHNRTFFLLFSSLSILSLIAAIMRLGWLVPCTIIGLIFGLILDGALGLFLDPIISGGWSMAEGAFCICVGVLVGLSVGLKIDAVTSPHSTQQLNNNKDP